MNNKTKKSNPPAPPQTLNCKPPGVSAFIGGKWWCIGEKTSTKRKKNKTKKNKSKKNKKQKRKN